MDGFYGRSHGLGIRLRPAKIAGEPLKEIFELLALEGPVVLGTSLGICGFRIVCSHGNLIAAIVGELTLYRILNLTSAS